MTNVEDVKVGHTMEVWWQSNRDTVTRIIPYTGRLECMRGGWIFYFAIWTLGMSVAPGDRFQIVGKDIGI